MVLSWLTRAKKKESDMQNQEQRVRKARRELLNHPDSLVCIVALGLKIEQHSEILSMSLDDAILKFNPLYVDSVSDKALVKKIKQLIDDILPINVGRKNEVKDDSYR